MYSPQKKSSSVETTTRTVELMKSDLDAGIKGEQDAIRYYENMAAIYGNYGWRWIFEEILKDERDHLAKLLEAKRAVEEKEKKAV